MKRKGKSPESDQKDRRSEASTSLTTNVSDGQFVSIGKLAIVFDVSLRHLYRLRSKGKLPEPLEIGNCRRYDVDECRELFRKHKNAR